MKFEDTGLPRHPAIEKSFETLEKFDKDGDKYTSRGVALAKLIADHGVHKDPEAIAASLLVPLAQDLGPFLCAKADLPGRVPDIIQGVFDFGKQSMSGAASDEAYKELDPAVRSAVLAAGIRMFQVTAEELESSMGRAPARNPGGEDAKLLTGMLQPVKKFTEMVTASETDEKALVKLCNDAMQRIEKCLNGAGIRLAPAAQPKPPSP